jgi:hypothetical protein
MKPKRPDPLFEVGEVVRFRLPHSELMLVALCWWNRKQQVWEYGCRIPANGGFGRRLDAVEPLLQVVENPEKYQGDEEAYEFNLYMARAAAKGG